MITHGVNIGVIGKHVYAIDDPALIPEGLKMVYISFVIIIFGCVFAKTSFAITLLRIVTEPWMKISLWFIIISMNLLMWTTGVSYLAQCSPSAALWRTELLATAKCWPSIVFEVIGMTAGGELEWMANSWRNKADFPTSLLRVYGLCAFHISLGNSVEPPDEQAREVWNRFSHEHGHLVSSASLLAAVILKSDVLTPGQRCCYCVHQNLQACQCNRDHGFHLYESHPSSDMRD